MFCRRRLLTTLLALYGLVTLGGPALHALPGFDHGAKRTSEAPDSPGKSDPHQNSSHDCPICHFQAQGQLPIDPADAILVDVVRIRPADAPPLVVPPALDRPSSPRAPPLA